MLKLSIRKGHLNFSQQENSCRTNRSYSKVNAAGTISLQLSVDRKRTCFRCCEACPPFSRQRPHNNRATWSRQEQARQAPRVCSEHSAPFAARTGKWDFSRSPREPPPHFCFLGWEAPREEAPGNARLEALETRIGVRQPIPGPGIRMS